MKKVVSDWPDTAATIIAGLPTAILGGVALFYAVFGLWVLAPDAVYSGDIGVKYVQARALADHGLTSMDIPYPGAFLDPAEEFLPMRPPFIMTTGGTTQAIFSPFSAVSQAIVVAGAGMRGLILLSIAGAVVTLWATLRIAPAGAAVPVLIALGIGGPLWFYAVSGWEHAPAVAFGTAAFAAITRASGPGARAAAIAGVLVGTGAVLRDEVLLLLPGVLGILWWRTRSLRPLGAAVAGLMLPLVLAAAVEVLWFHRPVAAHLRHAVHLVQSAAHLTDTANPDVPVLRPFTTRDRYETVVQYWLLGYGDDRWIAALGAWLAIAALLQWRFRSSLALLGWVGVIVVFAAIDLHEVVTAPKWLAGLQRVSPYLVFAVLPLPRTPVPRMPLPGRVPAPGWLRPAILLTAVAYLVVAFVGVDTSGGKSLGPRLLLPLLPLLAVSAIIGIGVYLRAPAALDRVIGATGVLLVGMAVMIHTLGCIPAYYDRNRDDFSTVRAVSDSGERLIVADNEFTAQLLLPLYYRRILLLADTPDGSRRLGALLAAERLRSLLVVTRSPDSPIDLAPFRKRRTELRGRMTIQFWER